MPQLFFKPIYVWFPVHLKGPEIPDPSGQLAELIVYITSTRVDLYSYQILLKQGPGDVFTSDKMSYHSLKAQDLCSELFNCFEITLVKFQNDMLIQMIKLVASRLCKIFQ